MNCELLGAYGIDYKKGLARCMNDESFYEKMLRLFLEDTSYPRALAEYEAQNDRGLFKTLHELKGACGNADMTELYDAVGLLVEYLRSGEGIERPKVEVMFADVTRAYDRAKRGVYEALGENLT